MRGKDLMAIKAACVNNTQITNSQNTGSWRHYIYSYLLQWKMLSCYHSSIEITEMSYWVNNLKPTEGGFAEQNRMSAEKDTIYWINNPQFKVS